MSTHADPETRHALPAETSDDPATGDAATGGSETGGTDATDEPAPIAPFDAHNGAATFGDSTRRLPNTVDGENKYRW